MNETANMIYSAIVAHTIWKKRLREVIDTGINIYDTNPEHCRFGTWLREEYEQLSEYANYEIVRNLHYKFHTEAHTIIQLAESGKKKEANLAVEYGSNFDEVSRQLVKSILEWHDVIIKRQ
jgi:deoxycytidylate deaminase